MHEEVLHQLVNCVLVNVLAPSQPRTAKHFFEFVINSVLQEVPLEIHKLTSVATKYNNFIMIK